MAEIKQTELPSVANNKASTYRPEETNPDLANTAMLKKMLEQLPKGAIVSREFTVFHGILRAMNHTEENKTYVDVKQFIQLFDEVSDASVNVDGFLIKNIFAYLMHPTYIIQGMPMVQQENKEPGFLSKTWGAITGRGTQPQPRAGAKT